jgi:hypothetical protein
MYTKDATASLTDDLAGTVVQEMSDAFYRYVHEARVADGPRNWMLLFGHSSEPHPSTAHASKSKSKRQNQK